MKSQAMFRACLAYSVLFTTVTFGVGSNGLGQVTPKATNDARELEKPASAAAQAPLKGKNPDDPKSSEATEPLPAIVVEVSGTVEWALAGTSVLTKEGWTPVKVNDKLEPTTQIRTGLRSHVNLKFGETTLISIRSATHAGIDQFYHSATTDVVRLGVGYGTVRGGSTEGEVRSDVIIDSTVATLAKRGTEGWQIAVEPSTGRFRISLAEFGLVEARQKFREAGRFTREVRPGEYANDTNIANLWIKQDIFNRNVNFFESTAMTESDAAFSTENTRGYGVMAPGGGAALPAYAGRSETDTIRQALDDDRPGPDMIVIEPGRISRPDGNFGTGETFKARTSRSALRTTTSRRAGR